MAMRFLGLTALSIMSCSWASAPMSCSWAPAPKRMARPVDTLDAGVSVRFIAVGDTGKGSAEQTQVGEAMGALCRTQGCDFVVLLGDNFYPTGVSSTSDPQWQTAFVQPYASVDVPFYAVLGNHDYGGFGSGNELEKGRHQVAYSKVNPKWRMPGTHYRFNQPPVVDFFVADTNRSMFAVDDVVRGDFESWVPSSTASWKIVFGHHPYKSNGRHGNAGEYDGVSLVPIANGAQVKSFVEEKVCGRADVYLSGHEHIMEWLKPTCTRPGSSNNTELIISGAGSSPTGFPSPARHEDRWRGDGLGFLYVVITSDAFTGTFYGPDGQSLFSRSIHKRPSSEAGVPSASFD